MIKLCHKILNELLEDHQTKTPLKIYLGKILYPKATQKGLGLTLNLDPKTIRSYMKTLPSIKPPTTRYLKIERDVLTNALKLTPSELALFIKIYKQTRGHNLSLIHISEPTRRM